VPRVEAHVERLRAEDAAAMADAAGRGAKDLDPAAVRDAPHRREYAGLAGYAAYLAARREVLYAEFVRYWRRLERGGFAERIAK
jgi:hypothetical protein